MSEIKELELEELEKVSGGELNPDGKLNTFDVTFSYHLLINDEVLQTTIEIASYKETPGNSEKRIAIGNWCDENNAELIEIISIVKTN